MHDKLILSKLKTCYRYSTHFTSSFYRRSYINAFKKWSDVVNLKVREVTGANADILIKYARGDHYDGSPFDGRGNYYDI